MKEPKVKYKIDFLDFKELKKYLSIPFIFSDEFKKGDIIELIDKVSGINRKCKVVEIKSIKDFKQAIILTGKI